jgi:hypothetical protein
MSKRMKRPEAFEMVAIEGPPKPREPMSNRTFMIMAMDPYAMFEWGNDEFPAIYKAVNYHARMYITIFFLVFYLWAINSSYYTRFQTGIAFVWTYVTVYPINLILAQMMRFDMKYKLITSQYIY